MAPQQRRKMSVYERTLEKFARMPVGDWYLKQVAPRLDPPLLRLTGGRVSSVYPVPVLLLTTTGAKTGLPRTLPLLYLDDGDDIVLKFHPQVAVELLVFVSDSRRCALDSQACSMVHCPRSPTFLR